MRSLRLLPDWKRVLRKAWSVRLTLLGAAFAGVEMALPLFSDAFPRHVFLALSIGVTVAGTVARLVAQPKTMGGDRG